MFLLKSSKGGIFFTALLFLFNIMFSYVYASPLQIEGAFNDYTFKEYNSFSLLEDKGGITITFHHDGNKADVSSQLLNKVITNERGSLVLKLFPQEKPIISFTKDGINLKWNEEGESEDDVFSIKEPPSYPLGPGDVIQIEIYGVEEVRNEVTVDPKGTITLPLLDKVDVKGFTIDQIQNILKEKYSDYIKDPQINIYLKEYGSRYVNVIGEVGNPSRIPLKRALRILDAISLAGGFTEQSGDLELQRIDKMGRVQKKKISKDSLLGANSQNDNIYLFDGDVVNILPISSIYLSGEVEHPQSLRYEKGITLLQAIAKAGGFTKWANKSNIVILRKNDTKTETIKVNAEKIEKGKIEDPLLFPNDHIIVKERKLF